MWGASSPFKLGRQVLRHDRNEEPFSAAQSRLRLRAEASAIFLPYLLWGVGRASYESVNRALVADFYRGNDAWRTGYAWNIS